MKNNKGFTLVELLVSVGIMSILMTLVTTMLINASRFFEKQSTLIDLNNEIQVINNYLTEAIMEATAVNFTIADDTTNMGRYELYRTDEATGDLTGKGVQRYLYYYNDETNTDVTRQHVLYVVAFKETDTPPDEPAGSVADDIYMVSNHMTEFSLEIDPDHLRTISETDPADPTATIDTDYIKNPVVFKIEYKLEKAGVTLECELTADCRNQLSSAKITAADSSVTEYKTTNR